MRLFLLLAFVALSGGLAACSSQPVTSSTRGVTLVRTGEVLDLRENAEVSAGPKLSTATIQFDDGVVERYQIDAAAGLQAGDKVTVSENRGKVRISRQ